MKRLVLAFMLLPGVALAQQPPPPPAIQTLDSMLHESVEREAQDRLAAITAQQSVAVLTKQLADVTAERDKLKATSSSPAQAATDPHTPPPAPK